jgi:hypothetical protein
MTKPRLGATADDATVPPRSFEVGDEVEVLRRLVEGTALSTGEGFFRSLVRHLGLVTGSAYCFVAELAEVETRVRTLAFWGKGRLLDNVEYDLARTPCEDVMRVGLCHHPYGVQQKFPRDLALQEMRVESYGDRCGSRLLRAHAVSLRRRG